MRADIAPDVRAGKYTGESSYSVVEDGSATFIFRDAYTFLTSSGNYPESFVGSFTYTYKVESVSGNAARVLITATNPTSINSATHLPVPNTPIFGSQGQAESEVHVPHLYGALELANTLTGGYETIEQEFA